MKKFLEELAKSDKYLYNSVPKNSIAERTYAEIREKFLPYVGHRARFISKITKEAKIVRIEEVHHMYLSVSYKYYGPTYEGVLKTCVSIPALFCGDERLDVE